MNQDKWVSPAPRAMTNARPYPPNPSGETAIGCGVMADESSLTRQAEVLLKLLSESIEVSERTAAWCEPICPPNMGEASPEKGLTTLAEMLACAVNAAEGLSNMTRRIASAVGVPH